MSQGSIEDRAIRLTDTMLFVNACQAAAQSMVDFHLRGEGKSTEREELPPPPLRRRARVIADDGEAVGDWKPLGASDACGMSVSCPPAVCPPRPGCRPSAAAARWCGSAIHAAGHLPLLAGCWTMC
jgi:hypothetical protein